MPPTLDFPAEDFVLNVLGNDTSYFEEEEPQAANLIPQEQISRKSTCPVHNYPHSFICVTCSKKMCYWCTIKTAHKKHKPMFIDEANKFRDEALVGAKEVSHALLAEVDQMVFNIDKNAGEIVKMKEDFNNKAAAVEKQLEDFFEGCFWELQNRKEHLKTTLLESLEMRNLFMKSQLADLYTAKRKLLKTMDLLNEKNICSSKRLLNNGKAQVELLQAKNLNCTPDNICIEFVPSNREQITTLGELNMSSPDDSSIAKMDLIRPDEILNQQELISPIQSYVSSGYSSVGHINSENEACEAFTDHEPTTDKNLPYSDTFFYPNNIIDVSFSDLLLRHDMWGKQGRRRGEFCRPWGVACDQSGKIIISDRGNHRVQVFNSVGRFLCEFGKLGTAHGEFSGPTGICVNPDGDILVVDSNNCRVQQFTIEGQYKFSFGNKGHGPGMFRFPWGIACNSEGLIAVSDFKTVEVQLFSKKGICLKVFNFCKPDQSFYEKGITLRGICFTPENDVLVTDYYNKRILKIQKDFKKASVVGKPYTAITCIEGPQGLACDKYGNIYVAETRFGNLKAFSADGECVLWSFGVQGQFALQFDRPSGISLTPEGRLAVVDFGNSRVQIL